MSNPKPNSRMTGRLLLAATLGCALLAIPCFADSQARIVRLSEVQGDVLIDRNTGQGLEKAFLNLPITQGVKIQTGKDGRAELEFEDGSTLRLVPETKIDIPQLTLRDSGTRISSVDLLEGTAYANFLASKDDEFNLTFVREKIALTHAAHLRIHLGDTDAYVGVFKGEVQVVGPAGTVEVSKNHKASFDLLDQDKYKIARDFGEDTYDAWDKQQDQYQQRYSDNSYASYSPYAYGTSDLNYYGNFSNVPGYGMMWQPYFAGAGWDPFMNGAWAFYPGFGYGWVSGYPWGWTPYHYGSWAYVPLYGWMWQPGGTWMGTNALPLYRNAPVGFRSPANPATPGQGIIPVNRGPASTLLGRSFAKVEIPNNSAGLGIPRGSISNLSGLSQTVELHGSATARVHTAPASSFGWGNQGFGEPSPFGSNSSMSGSSMHTSPGASSSGHSGGGGHR